MAIQGLRRPVFIVSCYDDRSRILCEIWREGVLVFHNSYLTSFMKELGLFAMAFEADAPLSTWSGPPLSDLYGAIGQKFIAEQMHAVGPSHLARVMLLEWAIRYERHFRRVYAHRDASPKLAQRSQLFARLASDFFMHHELGHVAEADPRFDRFIQPTIDAHLPDIDHEDRALVDLDVLKGEARADIFGLNCCFSIYAPILTEETLRTYCALMIQGVLALNVLHAAAHDLHRLNVDPAHDAVDVHREFAHWRQREAILSRYLTDFIFDERTIRCADDDGIGPIPLPVDAFDALLGSPGLVAPSCEDTRRLAELVSFGFEQAPLAFEVIIKGSRVTSILKDESGTSRPVSFTGAPVDPGR